MAPEPLDAQAHATTVLHEAYYKIMTQFAGNRRERFELYDYLRTVLLRLTAIDYFYVALLSGTERVEFPYAWTGATYDDPQILGIVPGGQTDWLLRNRRTYRLAYDGGACLDAGVLCGDGNRSTDAVTVPLFEPVRDRTSRPGRLFGMVSMHATGPTRFDRDAVTALEWLAEVLSVVLVRQDEDLDLLSRLRIVDRQVPDVLTSDHVLELLSTEFAELRHRAIRAADHEDADAPRLRAELRALAERCARTQSELVDLSRRVDDGPTRRFASLTPAEREVAVRLLTGGGNQDIADRIGVSLSTVKSHLASVFRKYGMTERSQVARDVRSHLTR
jgi:DNA-binding NarL/FixJ family response regulator